MNVPETNNYMQTSIMLAAEITAGMFIFLSVKGQSGGFKTKHTSKSHSVAC